MEVPRNSIGHIQLFIISVALRQHQHALRRPVPGHVVLTLGDAAHARRLLLRDVAEGLSPYGGLGVGLGELPGRLFCVNGGVVNVLLDVDACDPAGVGALRVVQAGEGCSSPRCFAVAAGSAGWWRCSPWCTVEERPGSAEEQHEAGATHGRCSAPRF